MILRRVGLSHRKGLHSGRKAARLSYFARGSTVKDKFFSIIAHALKSPFDSLLGMTEMMSKLADRFSKDQLVEYATNVNETGGEFGSKAPSERVHGCILRCPLNPE